MRRSRNCRHGGGGGGVKQRGKVDKPQQRGNSGKSQARIREGGGGTGGSGPPWKITSYMGSIGNKQLNPPPWKKLDPPPGKIWNPSGTLKNDSFL